jgi:dienelactone hydrolase
VFLGRVLAVVVCALALAAPAVAAEFTPADEAQNFSKINERFQHESGTPAYQALLRERGAEGRVEETQILATDPERDFSGNLCRSHEDGCAGDVRLWPKHWEAEGHGIAKPVLFTARNGSTLSGHVWATKAGPALRPGIVITNGSVQAPEELYLFAATTLAKAGFVVLTWDPQGQGRSDTYGEGVDRNEGFPSQSGQPFYDGTEDALDFFFSSPSSPYKLRKSCSTGTSHDEKQQRRVKAGLNAAHNPLSQLVDPSRVGVAGHSLGAAGVSYVGQLDKRVKAIVAWDNLGDSSTRTTPPFTCPSGASPRPAPVALTKPALGMSNDYGLTPTPYTAAPDEQSKNGASKGYTKAGVDTGQINTRGGTHYEYSYIPNPGFTGTLRGMDMAAWYTGAWFDKYVKGDATADRRLKTARWRSDAPGAAVDPTGDGNLYSSYLKSRLAFGGFVCEDVRTGCPGLTADDGLPPNYSYFAAATTKDSAATPPGAGDGSGVVKGGGKQRVRVVAPRLASDAGTGASFDVSVKLRIGDAADVDHYELQVARLGGSARTYRTIAARLGTGAHRFKGSAGAYRFRARAVSRGGVAGTWSYATAVVPLDQTRLTFSEMWSTVKDATAFGGSLAVTRGRPAAAQLRFRGSRVYLIGRRTKTGGRAVVVLDGRRRSISFRSKGTRSRVVVGEFRALGTGPHTLSLTLQGGTIALDAVGVRP